MDWFLMMALDKVPISVKKIKDSLPSERLHQNNRQFLIVHGIGDFRNTSQDLIALLIRQAVLSWLPQEPSFYYVFLKEFLWLTLYWIFLVLQWHVFVLKRTQMRVISYLLKQFRGWEYFVTIQFLKNIKFRKIKCHLKRANSIVLILYNVGYTTPAHHACMNVH